ncbi:MAG: prepilin-type N-terminal cleavage/methylation domain-containing protein [FCB group bacterium]|nr:prepilin-type N-terminal cleavage/methylation domain-containing protein [FCB group bacterium]
MKRIFRSNAGFTLIELLVALLITGIITAAMFRVYVNQHHAWMIQDSVIEMQQNARAAIDELTRQLRMTGYALPNGTSPMAVYNTNPDTIAVFYRNNTTCEASLDADMPTPSSELDCTGSDVSCFYVGQLGYIYDPNLETGEFFVISQVDPSPAKFQHSSAPLSRAYPTGSQVMHVETVKFFIDEGDTLHPMLMIQIGSSAPQPYASDIVDLQFTYTLKNGVVLDQPVIVDDIRQIGIRLISRSQTPDVEFTENPYRFETYQSQVYLRNM